MISKSFLVFEWEDYKVKISWCAELLCKKNQKNWPILVYCAKTGAPKKCCMVPKVAPRSPLHRGCVKTEGPVPTRKTLNFRNGPNEKVKPISLTLQNNLKGVNTFKIVLFDYVSFNIFSIITIVKPKL